MFILTLTHCLPAYYITLYYKKYVIRNTVNKIIVFYNLWDVLTNS